jgi:hypothetical protein
MKKRKFPESSFEALRLIETLESGAMQQFMLNAAVVAYYQYAEIIRETGKPFDNLLLSDVVNVLQRSLHAGDAK